MNTNEVVIHSATVVVRVLHHFKMTSCRTASSPLPPGTVLNIAMEPATDEERAQMHKNALSRGDWIPALFGQCHEALHFIRRWVAVSLYVETGNSHWSAGLHVICYLADTIKRGIWFCNTAPDDGAIVGYTDSDFVYERDETKYTSGYFFMLAGGAIFWCS